LDRLGHDFLLHLNHTAAAAAAAATAPAQSTCLLSLFLRVEIAQVAILRRMPSAADVPAAATTGAAAAIACRATTAAASTCSTII
tara:strand:- start:47 stop:301 length:255 start_codon:yes stop_codon:yes gene_type:complete